jgi:hypothetical protein
MGPFSSASSDFRTRPYLQAVCLVENPDRIYWSKEDSKGTENPDRGLAPGDWPLAALDTAESAALNIK